MMDRVAAGIAKVEKNSKKRDEWSAKFRWLLDDWKFVPGGRILTAAGTDQDLTYYNCYVISSPQDSREGIMTTLTQMTEIMSRGGGVGINISTLRPRLAYVKGVNGRSSGSVSWGALYSFVTGLIEQGGSRRGALMLILNDWHPDVFDFINSKREAGQITNANISVGVSDKLMEAVKADGDWELVFPDTDDPDYDELWDGDLDTWIASGRKVQHYKTIKARELWDAIIESAWASAEPGVWFNERSNKMANSWYFNPLISTNPCGEQPLGAFSVCNLGAINLSRFYDAENNDVAWDDLRQTIEYATRFLDNVIDTTPYFFQQNADVQLAERRVGLGTMGIAELMLKLKVRYGSDESVELIDKVYKAIAVAAYETSSDIAREKGAFPKFDAEKFLESGYMTGMPEDLREKIRNNGIRNVTLLTQAPTGTTGTMVNTSTGIEPFFSWVYYRKSRLGLHEEQVPIVKEWYEENPDADELPDYFATAMDLEPREHVKVQGAFQRWIDSAISKTCNVPNDYTVEQVSELYQYMYELGCKGGTIYRDGSRDEQVLMLKGDKRAESEMDEIKGADESKEKAVAQVATPHYVYPRPDRLSGTTVRTETPFGKAYITINRDDKGYPFEVFITIGKVGSDIQADADGLGRMISLQLRTTAPHNRKDMLKLIIEQLQDIGGARPIGFGPKRVLSLPDAVASVLMVEFFQEEQPQQLGLPIADIAEISSMETMTASANDAVNGSLSGADMCPECGTITLIRAEGCRKCLTCGYSEC
jgi:ribonucleoside-diphosphate reductase alpha chain